MANHANLATTLIANVEEAVDGSLIITVLTGTGGTLPASDFYVTAHNETQIPTMTNAEILHVTTRSGDTLYATREQLSTNAKAIVPGWRITNSLYAEELEGLSDSTYTHTFISEATINITHNLGKRPSVAVIDSAGDELMGTVRHNDANNLVISFNHPTSGMVVLN